MAGQDHAIVRAARNRRGDWRRACARPPCTRSSRISGAHLAVLHRIANRVLAGRRRSTDRKSGREGASKILLKSSWRSLLDWRLIMLSSLLIGGGVVAFVPTPSFPQYFVPPIPFLVLLFVVLADVAREDGRNAILPIMVAVALLGVLTGASRIVPGLMEFRKTSAWETLALKREVMKTADEAGLARGARVATLTPVFALEGGFSIYPEFAAGQFVFRVAPYISEADRAYYRTTSPTGLEAFLDADQPDGILVNRAEPIERALADYARSRGYETYTNTSVAQGFDLYVPARNIRSP